MNLTENSFFLTEAQQVIVEKQMHPQWIFVWYGFLSGSINGTYFYKRNEIAAVTVNDKHYRGMLTVCFFVKIKAEGMNT